jgi:hypothetical protein
MTRPARTLILLAALCLGDAAQFANAAESCAKECTISYQACARNHSQAACKNERDICLKHCQKK